VEGKKVLKSCNYFLLWLFNIYAHTNSTLGYFVIVQFQSINRYLLLFSFSPHDNIIRIYGYNEEAVKPKLVLEYADCGSLDKVC